MDLRRRFVEDYLTGALTMTALCADYQVSRKTGYKMLDRFEAGGWAALADQSRRPHHQPHAVPPAVVVQLCAARRRWPTWGARKLRRWLVERAPEVAWPSRGAIHAVLCRAGLVRQSARRPARPGLTVGALRPADAPNAVWTVDFKGDFRVGTGALCYPLTLRDAASRYTLRCAALAEPDGPQTRRQFRRAFERFGLPACIRSDNGPPFAGPGIGRLSQLAVWWMRLGIAVERIAVGRPDQNGSHEQFHRVLKAATARPPAPTLPAQQRRFDRFCQIYNHERPHQALDDAVPAARYTPSSRGYPARLPAVDYPGHWEPAHVTTNGTLWWRGSRLFLSKALAGQTVAFEEVDDGLWTVFYATVPLARWDQRAHTWRALAGG